MTREERIHQLKLKREKLRRSAKINFWDFCLYVDINFFKNRSSFAKEIAESMQKVYDGEYVRLAVSLPPRAGKSYITSLFCAWWLGRDNECAIMRNTHTARLALKFSNDIKDILKSEYYVEVFGKVNFKKDSAEEWQLQTAKTGISYFCAGVGGNITGFGCNGVAIIDDSVKNFEEANSDLQLEKKWEWYTGVHRARIEKHTPEIHIGTRWSTRDIMGMTEEAGGYDKIIRVPAIINNHTFCDAVNTTEHYNEEKLMLPEHVWEAEYMQNPVEAKGILYNLGELNRFSLNDLKGVPDGIVAVCDTADEGTDSLCAPVGLLYGNNVYVVDVVYNAEPIEVNQPLVAAMLDKWNVKRARFESNNGGKGFAQEVKRVKKGATHIEWKATVSNKHTRIIMESPNIKQNFYFRNDVEPGSDYWKYLTDLCKYKKAGGNKHDDAPDGTTMLSEYTTKACGITFLQ